MDVRTADYQFTSGGNVVTDSATGVLLYDVLRSLGVSDNATVTINTNDGFETGTSANALTFKDIPMDRIRDQEFQVTFEVGGERFTDDHAGSGTSSNIRIYRQHNLTGAGWLNRLTNILGVTVTEPVVYGFTLFPGGTDGIPLASMRAVAVDNDGGVWVGSNGAGMAYISATGEITSYTVANSGLLTNFVTGIAIAPDGAVWLAQGGSVGSINASPTAHHGFARYKDGQFTFFDRAGSDNVMPSDCVYGIDVDNSGVVWVTSQHTLYGGGMEGGLTRFDPAAASNQWRTWTMADGLPTTAAWQVTADNNGGAWVTM
jgi:ligand-binding sensor domain-containing protein